MWNIYRWDRQIYVADSTYNTTKYFDHVYKNFLIANYGANWGVDNDDGSSYYDIYNNFISYAQGGQKSYAGGHDNHQYSNIYGYIGTNPRDCQSNGFCGICFDITPQLQGHINWYFNNTCIIDQEKPPVQYGFINMPHQNCTDNNNGINQWPLLGNNTIYIGGYSATNNITGLCGYNEVEFQAKFNMDHGTKIFGPPNIQQILDQAKQMLWSA